MPCSPSEQWPPTPAYDLLQESRAPLTSLGAALASLRRMTEGFGTTELVTAAAVHGRGRSVVQSAVLALASSEALRACERMENVFLYGDASGLERRVTIGQGTVRVEPAFSGEEFRLTYTSYAGTLRIPELYAGVEKDRNGNKSRNPMSDSGGKQYQKRRGKGRM